MTPPRDLALDYYQAWVDGDRERATALLADDLRFTSPQDTFDDAASFLEACWSYGEELTGVSALREVASGDDACLVLKWEVGEASFVSTEWVRASDGLITEIIVLTNDPDFGRVLGERVR